jgi:hypothetical protein
MTSKPTNRNGVATSTPTNPARPPVSHGSRWRASPPTNEPVSSTTATPIRNATAMVCAMLAGRIPR